MIIFDFCKTLVPFNTTETFLNKIYKRNVLLVTFNFIRKLASKVGIYVEEYRQLKMLKFLFNKEFIDTKKWLTNKIDETYDKSLIEKAIQIRLNRELIILNTATFGSLISEVKFLKEFDFILSSNDKKINKGEQKILSILPYLKPQERKIIFSDSINEDWPLFLISDISYLKHENKLFQL
tara:strand:+ start:161 stop:700 length:540 start_codon:yes stop_codon:yes gene_type:complete